MNVIEENGHKWIIREGATLGYCRCVNCQMKYEYYLQIKRASEEQPDREDLKEWMKCKGK